jgi:hypothetical protein
MFSNPNRCHAVTYFFYQINKTQAIKFTIEAIRRRVVDPAADTRVTNNPFTSRGEVSVIPSAVLATDKDRLEIERAGRASAAASINEAVRLSTVGGQGEARLASAMYPSPPATVQTLEPLPSQLRAAALNAVDEDLARVGLLDKKTGDVSEETKQRFSFEVKTSLPTAGLLVRGCLDECNVCEPTLRQEIKLDLERKRLENEMLKRQTELLEESQEYRCCPGESTSEEEPDDT